MDRTSARGEGTGERDCGQRPEKNVLLAIWEICTNATQKAETIRHETPKSFCRPEILDTREALKALHESDNEHAE